MSTRRPLFRLQIDPWQALADGVEMTCKVVAGAGTLRRLKPEDVAVALTPKDAVRTSSASVS